MSRHMLVRRLLARWGVTVVARSDLAIVLQMTRNHGHLPKQRRAWNRLIDAYSCDGRNPIPGYSRYAGPASDRTYR